MGYSLNEKSVNKRPPVMGKIDKKYVKQEPRKGRNRLADAMMEDSRKFLATLP